MSKLRLFPFLILLLALYPGCSDDQSLGPSSGGTGKFGGPAIVSSNSVGPSEIVFCLDVSDSISADELDGMINALGASLSDNSLIPQDGRISVAALVYGDTVAATLGVLTPVTPQNLSDTIMPALDSLRTNRIVGGSGADLSGALESSLSLLGQSAITDLHTLVLGSGAADDPAGVALACTTAAQAGVMISAVGVGPDAAGAALLEDCAGATGGFYGDDGSLEDLCSDALAYMLQVDVDLEPEAAELDRGLDHTVTAAIFRGGDPAMYPEEGLEIAIAVVSGPNTADGLTGLSDENGELSFTYTGDGGPGTDTIVASAMHPGTGMMLSDTVTATWLNALPECDAGGPYPAVATTDTVYVQLDGSGSSDADGDSLRYSWETSCGEAAFDDATSATPVLMITGECLCMESAQITLTVSDGFDESTCQGTVQISDMRPPEAQAGEPLDMWPPNHKYRRITPEMMLVSAEDACGNVLDISEATVVRVTSDEHVNDTGDGNTEPDIRITCPNTVELRAERAGGGDGRVYKIVYRLTADNGQSVDVEAWAYVPHDSSGRMPGDDGEAYEVTPDCND